MPKAITNLGDNCGKRHVYINRGGVNTQIELKILSVQIWNYI